MMAHSKELDRQRLDIKIIRLISFSISYSNDFR